MGVFRIFREFIFFYSGIGIKKRVMEKFICKKEGE